MKCLRTLTAATLLSAACMVSAATAPNANPVNTAGTDPACSWFPHVPGADSLPNDAETAGRWLLEGSAEVQASSGKAAPYMLGSWRYGRNPWASGAMLDLRAEKLPDTRRRLDWQVGAEVLTGVYKPMDYARYDAATGQWGTVELKAPNLRIQQLYATLRYRALQLTVGQKERGSRLLDERLSSGDLVRSCNAMPVPGVEAGFNDFQDIPLTDGWVQLDGTIAYGKFTDDGWTRRQANHYGWVIAQGTYYHYKRWYFRTKPSQPLSITVGLQTAGQFGGHTDYYDRGRLVKSDARKVTAKTLWQMFFPTTGNGESWIVGNSLGSWDFKARLRLTRDREVSFAFQWPWEDGSGIGRRTGWDGLWGLYYNRLTRSLISGAAVEYLTFCNQSGPLHWAPADHPGTTITTHATGGDNLYNSDMYGAYDNFGLSIGSPFMKAPFYNANGYPAYLHTRTRGAHCAVTGWLTDDIDYKLAASYQSAWGNGRLPIPKPLHSASAMLQTRWQARCWDPALSFKLTLAADAGKLYGRNFGATLGISYQLVK